MRGVILASTAAGLIFSVLRIDVREHDTRARKADGVGRGDEGERRGNHLVAWSDPEREQHQVQGRSAGRSRHGILAADVLGEGCLEGGDRIALGELTRPQHLGHGIHLRLAQQGPGEWDGSRLDRNCHGYAGTSTPFR